MGNCPLCKPSFHAKYNTHRFQTAYLFAWLLLLRFEEVVRLQFESINMIPGMSKIFHLQYIST
jgi:hypothetical protein